MQDDYQDWMEGEALLYCMLAYSSIYLQHRLIRLFIYTHTDLHTLIPQTHTPSLPLAGDPER